MITSRGLSFGNDFISEFSSGKCSYQLGYIVSKKNFEPIMDAATNMREHGAGDAALPVAPGPPYDEAESDIAKGVKSDPARRAADAQKSLTPRSQ